MLGLACLSQVNVFSGKTWLERGRVLLISKKPLGKVPRYVKGPDQIPPLLDF